MKRIVSIMLCLGVIVGLAAAAEDHTVIGLDVVKTENGVVNSFGVDPAERTDQTHALVWAIGLEERYWFDQSWVDFMRRMFRELGTLVDDSEGSGATVEAVTDPLYLVAAAENGDQKIVRVFGKALANGYKTVVVDFEDGKRQSLSAADCRDIVGVMETFEAGLETALLKRRSFSANSRLYDENKALLNSAGLSDEDPSLVRR